MNAYSWKRNDKQTLRETERRGKTVSLLTGYLPNRN